MDNGRNDSMVDWILQLDTVPYTDSTTTFPSSFAYTIPQDEPIVYTSPQQQQSLEVCSTQQQLTMSHLLPSESTSPSSATTRCDGSGTGSIVTNPELPQLYEEKEQQQQDDTKGGEQQLHIYCQQQQQYHSQYQQPNTLIKTMPTQQEQQLQQQQQQQPQTAPLSPSQDNSNKVTSNENSMPTKRLKKPKSKTKSPFSSTSPTSIHGTEPLSGRLDFRPTMTDQVPENQLKTMSPRERRQLRNKISARNFRNRRKEYMTTMEEELDTCKSENKKLHAELAALRDKTNKLETENKQLRLDLVLYKEGLHPGSKQHQHQGYLHQQHTQNLYRQGNTSSSSSISGSLPSYTHQQQQQEQHHHLHQQQQPPNDTGDIMVSNLSSSPGTLHALSSGSSASPPDLNILHDFPYQQTTGLIHQDPLYQQQQQQQHQYHSMQQQYNAHHHHQQHQHQQLQLIQQQQQHQQCPPEMASSWNLPLPPDFNLHNMYLSHATMPEWDLNRLLSKAIEHSLAPPITNNISVTDTFQRFPLLAPALMSIVVGHTMTLSPSELMTLSTTNTATTTAIQCSDIKGKRLGVYPTRSGFDDKRALKIWQLLQPLTRRTKSFSSSSPPDNNNEKDNDKAGKSTGNDDGDDGGKDDDKGKDDSLKATIASYAAYFEGKCVVTAYVLGQMSVLHGLVTDESKPTTAAATDSRLSEIEDSSDDDDDDDDDEEETKPRPSEILPLCNEFKRPKELYIPVS